MPMAWLDRTCYSLFDKFAASALRHGCLELELPDGTIRTYGSGTDCESAIPAAPAWRGLPRLRAKVKVRSTDLFYKVITKHDVGMGEAFMSGDFEVDDLGAMCAVLTANARHLESERGLLGILNWLGGSFLYLAHLGRPNTVVGSRKNIKEHYDVGNEMYKLFLDDTLTYSSGIHHKGDSLKQAQLNKLDRLISAAGITSKSHVLEVGCGWGSCALRAVELTGCRWTGITVSEEQLAEGLARIEAAGLQGRITLMFCDYRDVSKQCGTRVFDAVVSCEMIEAVGADHLPGYFSTVAASLKPGGLFAMQVITMPDARYPQYCTSSDFIREHIFPGGHLPSMGALTASAGAAGLSAAALRDIGPDYAVTLRMWRDNWKRNWDAIRELGYSEVFMRKWEFYFAFCEAAFDCGYIQNYQITWRKHDTAAASCLDSGASLKAKEVKERVRSNPGMTVLDSDTGPWCGNVAGDALELHGGKHTFSDVVTRALFALYCVLAGIVVARRPLMITALLAFAANRYIRHVRCWLSADAPTQS